MTLYSLSEVCARLGLSPSGVRYHVYRSGRLRATRREPRLAFLDLDVVRFEAYRRGVGRPIRRQSNARNKAVPEREAQLLKMRAQGKSLKKICAAMGYASVTSVCRALRRARMRAEKKEGKETHEKSISV